MRTTPLIAGLLVAAAVTVLGCQEFVEGTRVTEIGSGTPASEDRDVEGFGKLSISASIRAEIRFGSPVGVRVTADDNLLDNLATRVVGDRLEITIDGSVQMESPMLVEVTVPGLTALDAASMSTLLVTGFAGDELHVRSESSATVEVDGTVGSLDVVGTSAGIVRLGELRATTASVELDSAAHAWVRATDSVQGSVSSAAVLSLVEAPADVAVETDSAGQVVTE
jgi:hypothetical protein